jgi:hypothetical protein
MQLEKTHSFLIGLFNKHMNIHPCYHFLTTIIKKLKFKMPRIIAHC